MSVVHNVKVRSCGETGVPNLLGADLCKEDCFSFLSSTVRMVENKYLQLLLISGCFFCPVCTRILRMGQMDQTSWNGSRRELA